MDGIISNCENLIGHTERDAEDVFDKVEDERSHDQVEKNDKDGSNDLPPDLDAVAHFGSTRGYGGKSCRALCCREDTDQEASHEAGHCVCMENAQGVVNFLEEPDFLAHNIH